ncbi:MAG: LysM peptidoglycan-binding domain-containing protein [Planctomycetota bacterium]
MTADAKVGLLLGLVFIVIIAFLVNGLPGFLQTANAEDAVNVAITTDMGPDSVIDASVVETARRLDRTFPLRQTTPPDEVVIIEDASGVTARQQEATQMDVYQPAQPVRQTVESAQVQRIARQVTVAKPKTHVVKSGENLAVIAQKYYGAEEGNRRAVINQLFEVNKTTLDAPDKIRVGDKIKVPTLEQLFEPVRTPSIQTNVAGSQSGFFKRFSNMFDRSERTDKPKAKVYIVQDGESLWGIAQEKLGDGNRYKEIMKINKIKNPDKVVAGTALRMPR